MKRFFKLLKTVLVLLLTVTVAVGLYFANRYNLIPQITYSAQRFGIETVRSTVDFNGNGTDDYTDMTAGTGRRDIRLMILVCAPMLSGALLKMQGTV